MCFHHWAVHSEHFPLSSLWDFAPWGRWEDAPVCCQEVLPLISFLSHRYLLIHPVGLTSSRRKSCTHSLFFAPLMNSSREMWPVGSRVSLRYRNIENIAKEKSSKIPYVRFYFYLILLIYFLKYNWRVKTHRRCWRRPPGRCVGTPLLRWGLPLCH